MRFLERVLEPPSYGFSRDGKLYVPSNRELIREFFSRMNVFRTRHNWLPAFCWFATLSLGVPLAVFLARYFSWTMAFAGFAYAMILLGTHGTIYLHRYSTHRAFKFRNDFWRLVVSNLVVKVAPEELYVVSHHVHHSYTEKPGDPYNAHGGFLYCFLADANHQPISRNLSAEDYELASRMLSHTGVKTNTYEQYQRWGSISHPGATILSYALNWAFWYAVFFAIGGHGLATAIFGMCMIWGLGVRTFNYDGHAHGQDKRRDGVDFNRDDLSINQIWPGYVAGEWHNNHHLYPTSARSGFLPYQMDLAWFFIRACAALGVVSSYRDDKPAFLQDHYRPYLERLKGASTVGKSSAAPPAA